MDQAYGNAAETSLNDAIDEYLQDLDRRGAADATKKIAREKCGHFVRLWTHTMPLSRVDARLVNAYIDARQKHASNFTIKKELGHLRQVLVLARHQNRFHLGLEQVFPPFFRGGHKPRKRCPSFEELRSLMTHLTSQRAAHVAFIASTGARLGESFRALRQDVDLKTGLVFLRGTKTEGSKAHVPITPLVQPLLEWALAHAPGKRQLFWPWGKLHRDMAAACKRAGIEPVTPNDLRRAFLTWHRQAGISIELLTELSRHTTTKLIETTYGRLQPKDAAALIAKELADRSIVPNLYLNSSTTGATEGNRRGKKPQKQAPPGEIESPTNGLGIRHQNPRSVGNKQGHQRRRAQAIVPDVYPSGEVPDSCCEGAAFCGHRVTSGGGS